MSEIDWDYECRRVAFAFGALEWEHLKYPQADWQSEPSELLVFLFEIEDARFEVCVRLSKCKEKGLDWVASIAEYYPQSWSNKRHNHEEPPPDMPSVYRMIERSIIALYRCGRADLADKRLRDYQNRWEYSAHQKMEWLLEFKAWDAQMKNAKSQS